MIGPTYHLFAIVHHTTMHEWRHCYSNIVLAPTQEVAKLLMECNVGIKARDRVEQRRLHTAAYYGSSQVVILLLEHKADTIARGLDKEIPLHSSV